MEKQILYNIINKGDNITIDSGDYAFFTSQFKDYLTVIDYVKNKGLEVNNDNVQLCAIILEKKLDPNYPQNDYPFEVPTETLLKQLQQEKQIKLKANSIKANLDTYLSTYDKTYLLDAENEFKSIYNRLSSTSNSVVRLEEIKKVQEQFINDRVDGKEVDGLYLFKKGNKTFFPELAKLINPIDKTDLVIIAGRPSVGKTSYTLAFINQLQKNGYRGLFFSLEMSNEQILNRMAVAKSGVPLDRIYRNGRNSYEYKEYMSALDTLSKQELYVVKDIPTNWVDTKTLIVNNKDKIDYVVIDYLGLLGAYDIKDSGDNRYGTITKITRDMKLLANEIKKPIIVLAQFNRQVGSSNSKKGDERYEEAFMRDLRDSGSLEQDADKILILYRKKEDEALREQHEKQGIYNVICKVDKNRAGGIGKVEYRFNGAIQRWTEKVEE